MPADAGIAVRTIHIDPASLRHADRGYVMRTGEVALSGDSAMLLANDDVRLIYLGGRHGRGGR